MQREVRPQKPCVFIPKIQEDVYLEEHETKHVKLNEDEMDTRRQN